MAGYVLDVYGGGRREPLHCFVDTQKERQPSPAPLDNSPLWRSGEKLH